ASPSSVQGGGFGLQDRKLAKPGDDPELPAQQPSDYRNAGVWADENGILARQLGQLQSELSRSKINWEKVESLANDLKTTYAGLAATYAWKHGYGHPVSSAVQWAGLFGWSKLFTKRLSNPFQPDKASGSMSSIVYWMLRAFGVSQETSRRWGMVSLPLEIGAIILFAHSAGPVSLAHLIIPGLSVGAALASVLGFSF